VQGIVQPKIVNVEPAHPEMIEDVRTMCLELAGDFCQLLRETLLGSESFVRLR
jgi:hypothetical protein